MGTVTAIHAHLYYKDDDDDDEGDVDNNGDCTESELNVRIRKLLADVNYTPV